MKKRAKIITTIASLCLAVALMAFGVYAAQSATMQITSSVSFTATDVNVEWTLSAVKNATSNGQGIQDIETLTGTTTYHLGLEANQGAAEENASREIPNVEFDLNHRTITYTFSCQNLSNKQNVTIEVDLDDEARFTDVANVLTVTYKQGVSGSVAPVANDGYWQGAVIAPLQTYVYQVVLHIDDITSDINTEAEPQTLDVSFIATRNGQASLPQQQQNP